MGDTEPLSSLALTNDLNVDYSSGVSTDVLRHNNIGELASGASTESSGDQPYRVSTYSYSDVDTSNSTKSGGSPLRSTSGPGSEASNYDNHVSGSTPALDIFNTSSNSSSSKRSNLQNGPSSSVSSLSENPPQSEPISSLSENPPQSEPLITSLSENPPPDRSASAGSSDGDLSALAEYDARLDFNAPLQLRKFQEEVSTRCRRGENDIIILPTGTGKTYVAIQVIKDHLEEKRPPMRCKVVFLVPTSTLASQQLQKIKEYVSEADSGKCKKVTGDDNLALGHVKKLVKENEYRVLVVTPAILNNYFEACRDASIGDFTLLIFDECHHAKEGHPYNVLLEKYHRVKWDDLGERSKIRPALPQLIGMSASIGVGTSKSMESANDFMLSMFARFDLGEPPVKVTDNIEELKQYSNRPNENIVYVDSHRQDGFTDYLERSMMSNLEGWIIRKARVMFDLTNGKLDLRKLEFPTDRHSQVYEQFLIEQRTSFMSHLTLEEIKEHCNYVLIALEHLLIYYKTLELVNLLDCRQGLKYILAMDRKPNLQSVEEIWDLREANMETLQDLGEEVDEQTRNNEKLTKLSQRLTDQFKSTPDSKIIIFVRMRVVAKYLAEWLYNRKPTEFRAKEFTSSGPSIQEGGMKPSQLLDAREGFENDKYNILVSTSVLEEGIDIQACNMVIRYMYSKDMIGKIQARGRVRHKDGQIVTILDSKLLQQEKKNEFKESLMNQALNSIQDMDPEKFRSLLKARRLHMFPRKFTAKPDDARKTTAPILCAKCGAQLGNLEDIRCFMRAHHLVLDPDLHERVQPFPDERTMPVFDGVVPLGLLNCRNETNGRMCNNQVGVIIRMSDLGASFGMWNIKAVLVGSRNYKKYQKVKEQYIIPDVYLEDIAEVAVEKQFNVEVLSQMRNAVGM